MQTTDELVAQPAPRPGGVNGHAIHPVQSEEKPDKQHSTAAEPRRWIQSASPAKRQWGGQVVAALVATAPLSPILAGVFTVTLFTSALPQFPIGQLELGRWTVEVSQWADFLGGHHLTASLANVLIAWLLLTALFWALGLTTPERADARSYGSFISRLTRLKAQWVTLESVDSVASDDPLDDAIARQEIQANLEAIDQEQAVRDARWVLGDGYISLWRKLNRAEEALLRLAPRRLLAAEMRRDLLRLDGCSLKQSGQLDELLTELKKQLVGLEGEARDAAAERAARNVAPQVRYVLDHYRLSLWICVLQARNRLLASIIFTSFTVYVLLWLSIAANASKEAIIAATGLYFTGATIGLFNRLYADWKTRIDSTESDYNLAIYELLGVPLLSGVAAVLGVLLTSAASLGQAGATSNIGLADIFEFIRHPLNLVTATVFGLTPGLVLDRMNGKATAKKDLKSMEPHEQSATQGSGA
jgi:hypothetical protein